MSKAKLMSKEHKRLAKALRPYGVDLAHGRSSGHINIMYNDKVIWHMSGTPKNMHHAIDNTIKDLRKLGVVPKDFRV